MLFYCKAGTFEVNNLKNAFENAQATGKDKVTKSTLELKEKESLITSASFRNGITPLGECFFVIFPCRLHTLNLYRATYVLY